ncbi:thioredoxin family protein [Verrucomicrobiaceae bacterium 227]
MKKLSLFASAAFLATSLTYAGGEGWMHDFEAAKAKAAKENKDLLIDFTGSDWCGWCIKLNEEVFSHDPFKEGVADKYVLVELDYPRDKSILDEKTIKQNEELRKVYPVQGFPTILLADAQGRPFAQTGYQKGGPEAYLTHLAELNETKTKRDEAFAAAEKAEGVEKAKGLYSALQLVPEAFQHLYADSITEIKKLDPKDETGIAAAEKARNAEKEFESSLQAAMKSGNTDEVIKLVDNRIADQKLEGEEKQQALTIKINPFIESGDFDKVETLLDEIIAVSPDSRLSKAVEQFRTNQLPKIKESAANKEKKDQ